MSAKIQSRNASSKTTTHETKPKIKLTLMIAMNLLKRILQFIKEINGENTRKREKKQNFSSFFKRLSTLMFLNHSAANFQQQIINHRPLWGLCCGGGSFGF